MEIRPIGEAVYSIHGHSYIIPAVLLKQHDSVQLSGAAYKGDPEGWSMSCSAYTKHGFLTWDVYFSMGMEGIRLDGYDLVRVPDSVEIISDIQFEEFEGEC
jgi:hypothetical protein